METAQWKRHLTAKEKKYISKNCIPSKKKMQNNQNIEGEKQKAVLDKTCNGK